MHNPKPYHDAACTHTGPQNNNDENDSAFGQKLSAASAGPFSFSPLCPVSDMFDTDFFNEVACVGVDERLIREGTGPAGSHLSHDERSSLRVTAEITAEKSYSMAYAAQRSEV